MTHLPSSKRFMGLTLYGFREWFTAISGAVLLAVISIILGIWLEHLYLWVTVAFFFILAGLAVSLFFRDPRRIPPERENLIVSPADGVVYDFEETPVPEGGVFAGHSGAMRIGIFLSVLDVHINRAPCRWNVQEKMYRKGSFHDARDPRAGRENEAMLLGGEANVEGNIFPLSVRQVSGAIARRIVCIPEPGTSLERAERYGMIKFGSRTEVYLPIDRCINICVKPGDVVRAGKTVIAEVCTAEGTLL